MFSRVMHHLHLRKRIHQKKEKYPSYDKKVRIIDNLASINAFFMPLTVTPQLVKLFIEKDAGSLSITMWVLYTIGCLPMLAYGILHKEKPIIILNVLWTIMNTLMIILILTY